MNKKLIESMQYNNIAIQHKNNMVCLMR